MIGADGWKLVASAGKPWELYHVSVDATETTNRAGQDPSRVAAMARMWQEWAGRVGAEIPAGG